MRHKLDTLKNISGHAAAHNAAAIALESRWLPPMRNSIVPSAKDTLSAHLLWVDDIPQEIVHVSERETLAGDFVQYNATVL
jgi:hypothetical protein